MAGLLKLCEACRSYLLWPMPKAEKPTESLADLHNLFDRYLLFINFVKVEISRDLYSMKKPKYPLSVAHDLLYSGKSSFIIRSTVSHPNVKSPYAIVTVRNVIVDLSTRKPTRIPAWWSDKVEKHLTSTVKPLVVDSINIPSDNHVVLYQMKVVEEDTDSYGHVNWTSYVQFCVNACHIGVLEQSYRKINRQILDQGIKTVEMAFKHECSHGEELTVLSWERKEDTPCLLYFHVINKNEVLCFQATFEFYDTREEETRAKL